MKEYRLIHGSNATDLERGLNTQAKQGWVPTHFAMSAGPEVDSFAVLLERETRESVAIRNAEAAVRGDSDVH